MRYKHVFAVCAYKDSPYLEQCIRSLKAQTVPSHIIICTSTPSSYMTGWPGNTACRSVYGGGRAA